MRKRGFDSGAWALFALAFLAAMGIVVIGNLSIPAIILLDERGARLARIALEDSRFVHRYMHSIHKTPVDEEFYVEGDSLELIRLRYDTYGVGMPSDSGDGFRIEDGRFVVDLHRSFKRLDIRVSHLPGHGIVANGDFLPFTTWVEPESVIVLKAGIVFPNFSRRKAHP